MSLTGTSIGAPRSDTPPLLTPETLRDAVHRLETAPYCPPIVILPPGTTCIGLTPRQATKEES